MIGDKVGRFLESCSKSLSGALSTDIAEGSVKESTDAVGNQIIAHLEKIRSHLSGDQFADMRTTCGKLEKIIEKSPYFLTPPDQARLKSFVNKLTTLQSEVPKLDGVLMDLRTDLDKFLH